MSNQGRVLVVEDHESERRALMQLLKSDGFAVFGAESADKALGYVDESIDVVLSDLHMGDVSGLDLLAYRHPSADPLELIRKVTASSSGPVIVAGSIASVDRAVAVSEAGAWDYTIGSAIFDGLLPGAPSVADQVRRVIEETASAAEASRGTT